jgi:ribose transport system substrate-binding protein
MQRHFGGTSRRSLARLLTRAVVGCSVAALLAACGSSGSSSSAATASAAASVGSTSATKSTGGYKVVLVSAFPLAGNPFYVTLECTAKSEANKLGMSLSVDNPQASSVENELPLLQAAIADHPNAIILSSVSTAALTPTVHSALEEGIKVVNVDQLISDSAGLSSVIKYNIAGVSQQDADILARDLGHKGQVLVVNAQAGTPVADALQTAFVAALPSTGLTLNRTIYTTSSNASTASVATEVASALTASPDIKGIYATTASLGEGALQAIRETGKTGITVVGAYTDYEQLAELKAGQYAGLAGLPAGEMGQLSAQEAYDAITGKATKNYELPVVSLTKSNLNSPAVKPYLYVTSCGS